MTRSNFWLNHIVAISLIASGALIGCPANDDDDPTTPAVDVYDADLAVDLPTADPDVVEPDIVPDLASEPDTAQEVEPDLPEDLATEEEMVDTTICPPTPAGLPDVTIEGTGRYRTVGPFPYDDLLPRNVTVYLPATYETHPDRHYPVLYMHDGQNLFDPAQASFGVAWEVDDSLGNLIASGRVDPHIVVGIDNTFERIEDYTPDFDPEIGAGGKGDRYADLLVDVIKPIIDANFRTVCGPENTTLAGSSLGGLITLHIALRHPGVFGAIGLVSPSLWWHDGLLVEQFVESTGTLPSRIWLDVGTEEGFDPVYPGLPAMMQNTRLLRELALEQGYVLGESLGYLEDFGAGHNEAAWQNRLDSILLFLLGDTPPNELAVTELSASFIGPAIIVDSDLNWTTTTIEAVHGNLIRMTWLNEDALLSNTTPDLITIDDTGLVTALAPGTATVDIGLFDLTDSASIEVLPDESMTITLSLTVPVGTPGADTIYVSGDLPQFGAWEPGVVPLTKVSATTWTVSLEIPYGVWFEYKYTRGSWETVEKNAGGGEIANRVGRALGDDTHVDTVVNWADW